MARMFWSGTKEPACSVTRLWSRSAHNLPLSFLQLLVVLLSLAGVLVALLAEASFEVFKVVVAFQVVVNTVGEAEASVLGLYG